MHSSHNSFVAIYSPSIPLLTLQTGSNISEFRKKMASKYGLKYREPAAQQNQTTRDEEVHHDHASDGGDIYGEASLAPRLQRVLSVDLGRRRTGLAFSAGGFAPRPVGILRTDRDWPPMCREIVKIGKQNGAEGIVVGMPVTRDGNLRDRRTDSKVGRVCRNFAYELAVAARAEGVCVLLVDEKMSTSIAEESLELSRSGGGKASSGPVDDVAAAIILQMYFEHPDDALLVRAAK